MQAGEAQGSPGEQKDAESPHECHTRSAPVPPSLRYRQHLARMAAPVEEPKPDRIPKVVRRSMSYILARCEPELNTGCWLWSGGTDKYGYGTQWIAGRVVYAHRLFYERHKGEIPAGLVLRHKCDTPACVNPAHLIPGTQRDNTLDAQARGRRPVKQARS